MAAPIGIVFGADPRRPWLAERSARSLRAAGFVDVRMVHGLQFPLPVLRGRAGEGAVTQFAPPPQPSPGVPGEGERETLQDPFALPSIEHPTFFLRAGAWLRRGPLPHPPPSATGRTVVAVGLPLSGRDSAAWREARAGCGGDFSQATLEPPIVSAWVIPSISKACDAVRLVHWPPADVFDSERFRVVQVVTSLQRGGAERVAWDLHHSLPACGVECALVALGAAPRRALPTPPRFLSWAGLDEESRTARLAVHTAQFGADLLHLHLVRGDEMRRMAAATDLPVATTIHNTRAGWPEGIDQLADGALLIACAQAVERELLEHGLKVAVRTAWNGIDTGPFASLQRRTDERRLTLACIANPRPQKRIDRLPAMLAALKRMDDSREVRLIVAGESPTGRGFESSAAALDEMWRQAAAHGVTANIEWTNGQKEVADLLAEADICVSLSAHEGLSLALLEAMAAGVPVVATDVGGNAELAKDARGAITLIPADSTPQVAAQAVVAAVGRNTEAGAEAARRHFTREKMADRYAALYRTACGPRRGETFWFIANNLSTGGAQSSLRRLVKAFQSRGRRVRVVVLQEQADNPTPGRVDLCEAGIDVLPLPPAGEVEPGEAVEMLLAEMRADPPRAVTFWNALQSYKVLIADALLHVPVFDVSPGEMFYTSLDAYFAKPRSAVPYSTPRDYGARLAGMIVKYAAEAPLAVERLGASVHVIPNGVVVPPAPVARLDDGKLVIGTAARLHPHKRLEDLIDAFRLALPRLPNSQLRIAGAPDFGCEAYADALRSRAVDVPVVWLGGVTDVAAFHTGLDLFAMISEPAGCPNASLEAMAAGLPVAATDVGGAGEQVIDGETGRLCPPSDVPALADALVDLGACRERRRLMGAAGRRRIEEVFSIERMVEAYLAVLDAGGEQSEIAHSPASPSGVGLA